MLSRLSCQKDTSNIKIANDLKGALSHMERNNSNRARTTRVQLRKWFTIELIEAVVSAFITNHSESFPLTS